MNERNLCEGTGQVGAVTTGLICPGCIGCVTPRAAQRRREQICDEVEAALPLRESDARSLAHRLAEVFVDAAIPDSAPDAEHRRQAAKMHARTLAINSWIAVARASRGEVPPTERTPETVLRAMLRAYEAAALEAHVGVAQHWDRDAACAATYRETLADRLRQATAAVIAGKAPIFGSTALVRDYEARLSGTTALDAPPAEA